VKAVLICPDPRAGAAFFSRKSPLVLTPVLGPSLLSNWLSTLADSGVKEVIVFASDRPSAIRAETGRGERWGLKIEVLPEPRELSVAEARARFGVDNVTLADHLPGLPDAPLFTTHAGFFAALERWLPLAGGRRVGAKEISPGIWSGLRCKIDPSARLVPPCWLGDNIWIRAHATIGPLAFIEDSSFVDHDAEVDRGWVGPRTYVGALTHVSQSLAWADGLLNHATDSFIVIVDTFLLGGIRGESGFARSSPWYGRLMALLAFLLTSPLLLVAALRNRGSGHPLIEGKRAVIPGDLPGNSAFREMAYSELNGFSGLARRWPQLWSIVRGDFSWVGNRPLDREQAAQLETEFERLWLAAPVGFVSLADTFGCGALFDDEARAHSAFYAARAGGPLDRAILRWLLFRAKANHRL
jgi:hypothetical protein